MKIWKALLAVVLGILFVSCITIKVDNCCEGFIEPKCTPECIEGTPSPECVTATMTQTVTETETWTNTPTITPTRWYPTNTPTRTKPPPPPPTDTPTKPPPPPPTDTPVPECYQWMCHLTGAAGTKNYCCDSQGCVDAHLDHGDDLGKCD